MSEDKKREANPKFYCRKLVNVQCPPDPDEQVWGVDEKWILQFDNLIKHSGFRTSTCECEIHALSWRLRGRYEDEIDRPIERTVVKKLQTKKPPAAPLSSTPLSAGAVDEEFFTNAFEDVPTVQIFSAHELKEMVISIANTIGNPEMDWDKRVDAFKRVRSLLIAGAANFEDFNDLIKKWELPFVESLKDLRSHVVRETCVTIAYLAQTLGIKFGRFAEVVFQNLVNLMQSSAKVIASAGFTSIRFIIQNVHNQRLLPIINNNLTSRSREIRKAMCDVLDQLIHTWPLSILDKRIPLLQEAVKRGVSDADMEARVSARRAFWAFKGYFPEQADALLSTLDYSYKKSLYGDVSLSGSNQSLNQGPMTRQASAPSRGRIPTNATGSSENIHHGMNSNQQLLHRTPSLPRSRRSGIPVKTNEGERSLSPCSGSSPSIFTSISKEDYFLNTSSCLTNDNKDILSRCKSVTSLKSTSKSSLIDKLHGFKLKKRKRLKKKRFLWGKEKYKILDTESNQPNFSNVIENRAELLEEISRTRNSENYKIRINKKESKNLYSRDDQRFLNQYIYWNRSSPSLFWSQKSNFLCTDRLACEKYGSVLSDFAYQSLNKDVFHAVFTTLSSLILFEDHRMMQNSLRKCPKMIDNKIVLNLKCFSSINISLEITGNRRKDKIKLFDRPKRRFCNIRDEETMTELTGFQEEFFGLNKFLSFSRNQRQSILKKTPKILNLSNLLDKKIVQEEKNCEKELLNTVVKDCKTVSKKQQQSDFADSSKTLIYIFRNKIWFGENESICNFAQENIEALNPHDTNLIEKEGCNDANIEESVKTVLSPNSQNMKKDFMVTVPDNKIRCFDTGFEELVACPSSKKNPKLEERSQFRNLESKQMELCRYLPIQYSRAIVSPKRSKLREPKVYGVKRQDSIRNIGPNLTDQMKKISDLRPSNKSTRKNLKTHKSRKINLTRK